MYNAASEHINYCDTKIARWLRHLRRCPFPPPMIREMARAKLGGFLSYSMPFIHFPDSTLDRWQSRLNAAIRGRERLPQFAATGQLIAPYEAGGCGNLNLRALRDSCTIRVAY